MNPGHTAFTRIRCPGLERGDRGGVDDRPALPARDHQRGGIADAERDRPQQQRLGAIPILRRDCVDRVARSACARVVEHHVEPARGVGGVHQRLDIARFQHVGPLEMDATVRCGGNLRTARFVDVADPHFGAFAGQPERSCAPDSRCRASDDGPLARKTHTTLPTFGHSSTGV
jgi:hypothetical protein